MGKPQHEVAEVFRAHQGSYLKRFGASLPTHIHKAINAIVGCRTAALGGHILECDHCGKQSQSYNSCRNRSCPKCEGGKQAQWLEEREKDLLPVHYFHLVFTLPHVLNHLVLLNQEECLKLFFDAVRKTLLKIGKSKLKATIGFFAILHTWGQQLEFHPHLHCVLPGGGISLDGKKWIHSSKKRRYFVSQKVLSRVFRGIFIQGLKRLYRAQQLQLTSETMDFEALLNSACRKDWVVHCKPPFGGPEVVLKYLARYTHRIAISNSRLVAVDSSSVTFRYRDYRNKQSGKLMTLSGLEFMRRFLMHVPLPGFVRIRHCGFLANRNRTKNIANIRTLLGCDATTLPGISTKNSDFTDPFQCPHCHEGTLIIIDKLLPIRINRLQTQGIKAQRLDSS